MKNLVVGLLEASIGVLLLLTSLFEAPLELLDFVVSVLFGFGKIGELFLVVELHVLSISLLSLQLALQIVNLLACVEVLN